MFYVLIFNNKVDGLKIIATQYSPKNSKFVQIESWSRHLHNSIRMTSYYLMPF